MTAREQVLRALSSVTPKTIVQLAEETGLSPETVRRHVRSGVARQATTPELNVKLTMEGVIHTLGYLRIEPKVRENPVRYWRNERSATGERVRTLSISEHADPAELAEEFLSIGRQLLAIGKQIDRVKMDPDWYTRLGGHFWLSDTRKEEE